MLLAWHLSIHYTIPRIVLTRMASNNKSLFVSSIKTNLLPCNTNNIRSCVIISKFWRKLWLSCAKLRLPIVLLHSAMQLRKKNKLRTNGLQHDTWWDPLKDPKWGGGKLFLLGSGNVKSIFGSSSFFGLSSSSSLVSSSSSSSSSILGLP